MDLSVLIGLVSTVEESLARGSSAAGRAPTVLRLRRHAMPITPHVRGRVLASEPACLLVKAAAVQGTVARRVALGDDALWTAA